MIRPGSTESVGRFVLHRLRPYFGLLVGAALLAGVISLCKMALVFVTRDLLNETLQGGTSDGKGVSQALFFSFTIILLFALQAGARVCRIWITRYASVMAERRLRTELFEHILLRSPERLQRHGRGEALTNMTVDASRIRTAVGALVTVVQRPLSALAILAAATQMSPRLTLVAVATLPLVGLVILGTTRATRRESAHWHAGLGRLTSFVRDVLDGHRTIRAYRAEQAVALRFDGLNRAEARGSLRSSLFRMGAPPAVELASAIAVSAVVYVGLQDVNSGAMDGGQFGAFLVALGLLSEPLKGISVATGLWAEARGGLARVHVALLDDSSQTSRVSSPLPQPSDAPSTPLSIRLQGLRLERGDKVLAEDIDLQLGASELVIVQGENGSGKSSLLDLLIGFIEPGGLPETFLWDGRPAGSIPPLERRRRIALVDQETWIGVGTIEDAIRIGRPDASACDLREAARAAGLSLPLETVVGDGGRSLSGGEAQRVSLARAMLSRADLLLLDEPCAHLDTEAEEAFLRTLETLSGERAILMVTHRTAPLLLADRVFQFANGKLIPGAGGAP